jgi:GAF domain-containing protein
VYNGQAWYVPIRAFGLLEVSSRSPLPQDEPLQYWLAVFGRELYPALYQQFTLHKQVQQMQGVIRFSQFLKRGMSIESTLEITLAEMIQIMQVDDIAILMTDAHTNNLKTVARLDEHAEVQVDYSHGQAVNLEGTTAGYAWQKREAIRVKHLQTAQNLRYTRRDDIQSALVAPIYSHGAIIGLVEAGSTNVNQFSNIDNAIFQQLVRHLSIAFEYSESYIQSKRLARSKVLMNDITNHLQQQFGIEPLLEVIVKELGHAFDAKKARIHLRIDGSESEL